MGDDGRPHETIQMTSPIQQKSTSTTATPKEYRRRSSLPPLQMLEDIEEVQESTLKDSKLNTIAEEEKKSDVSDSDDQKSNNEFSSAVRHRSRRSLSESSGSAESVVAQNAEGKIGTPNFMRSISNDAQRPNPAPLFEKNGPSKRGNQDSQEAIDKYYDRNQYTVTGRDNYNTYNRLPLHLQRRIAAAREQDTVSRVSTPGAMGEAVPPTERNFGKSVYWLAFNRKKIGFRHVCLAFLVLVYTVLGASIFYLIEGTNEKAMLVVRKKNLDDRILELAKEMVRAVNDPDVNRTMAEMQIYLKESYIDLQKQESQYKWSTFYKLEDPDRNLKWTFSSAFFFSMNVYTTTGYGAISCETTLGQSFTIFYGFLFVPVTLVVLRDLGQLCLVHTTKVYAHALTYLRKLRGQVDFDDDEIIQLPIKFCLGLLLFYLLFCTTFVYLYDALMGVQFSDGISYFLAFYFSFISLSTIGLGDVMPNNVPYAPVISILFFMGMALTKVVNRATYIAVENGIFGTMTVVENKLDGVVTRVKPTDTETPKPRQSASVDAGSIKDTDLPNEYLNNFTVRSIATFMRSNADVYGGGFGRVHLRRGDLLNSADNQNTVNSGTGMRQRAASASAPASAMPHPAAAHHRESANL